MSFVRFIGILLIAGLLIASGVNKVVEPLQAVAMIKSGNFPKILKLAQIPYKLGDQEYILIAQATGGVMAGLAVFMVLGIFRSFSAFVLALVVAGITVCQHLNLEKPAQTPVGEMIHILKNAAIIGGLLVVSTLHSGARKAPAAAQNAANGAAAAANKKRQ